MKKYLFIFILSLITSLSYAENYIMWGTTNGTPFESGVTNSGTPFSCDGMGGVVSTDIWSVNISSGATTSLASWDRNAGCGSRTDLGVQFRNGSWFDSTTGYIYGVQEDNSIKIFDAFNNGSLEGTFTASTWDQAGHTVTPLGRQQIGIPKIIDGNGDRIIESKSDGSIHIGKNSLVTQEVNGRQDLYATDSGGNQIDINIKSGTNLLIDGTNITSLVGSNSSAISNLQQDLSGSVALSSALAALPNSSPDAFYTCGLGTGIHDSSSALSAGCASDFSNYAFVDKMPKIFQTASFNVGSSFLMNGEPDISETRDMSIKAGITFKFGSVKPTRVSDRNNYMMENKIDAVMQENRTLKAQLKEENEAIRQENNLLKAQIAEINTQLKALNMLAMN